MLSLQSGITNGKMKLSCWLFVCLVFILRAIESCISATCFSPPAIIIPRGQEKNKKNKGPL